MRLEQRSIQWYACETCNTPYEKEDHAKQCQARGVEELKIKLGEFFEMEFLGESKGFFGKKLVKSKKRAQICYITGPCLQLLGDAHDEVLSRPISEDFQYISFDLQLKLKYGIPVLRHIPPPSGPHKYQIHYRFENFDKPFEPSFCQCGQSDILKQGE